MLHLPPKKIPRLFVKTFLAIKLFLILILILILIIYVSDYKHHVNHQMPRGGSSSWLGVLLKDTSNRAGIEPTTPDGKTDLLTSDPQSHQNPKRTQ